KQRLTPVSVAPNDGGERRRISPEGARCAARGVAHGRSASYVASRRGTEPQERGQRGVRPRHLLGKVLGPGKPRFLKRLGPRRFCSRASSVRRPEGGRLALEGYTAV